MRPPVLSFLDVSNFGVQTILYRIKNQDVNTSKIFLCSYIAPLKTALNNRGICTIGSTVVGIVNWMKVCRVRKSIVYL